MKMCQNVVQILVNILAALNKKETLCIFMDMQLY